MKDFFFFVMFDVVMIIILIVTVDVFVADLVFVVIFGFEVIKNDVVVYVKIVVLGGRGQPR